MEEVKLLHQPISLMAACHIIEYPLWIALKACHQDADEDDVCLVGRLCGKLKLDGRRKNVQGCRSEG